MTGKPVSGTYDVQQPDFGGLLIVGGSAQAAIVLPSVTVPGADKGLAVFAEGSGGFTVSGNLAGMTVFAQYETARIFPGVDGLWHVGGAAAPGSAGSVSAAVTAAIAAAIAAVVPRSAVVVGAAAGNITVTGLAAGATLTGVIQMIGAGTAVTDVANLTSQFTVTAANTINNTGGTDTTGSKLLVQWI